MDTKKSDEGEAHESGIKTKIVSILAIAGLIAMVVLVGTAAANGNATIYGSRWSGVEEMQRDFKTTEDLFGWGVFGFYSTPEEPCPDGCGGRVYVVEHRETWTNGTILTDVSSDGYETLAWDYDFFEMAWPTPLTPGTYELILDLNVSGHLGVWTDIPNPYSGPATITDPIWTINVTESTEPGISVDKTASTIEGAPCTDVTFTIEVTNTGDCTLDPVRVEDTLPTWMSYASSDPEANETVGTITWYNVGPLDPLNSTTITLVAHIDSGASGTLNNTANATGTPLTGENVTGSDTAEVTALTPDINVTKTASPTTGAPCTDVTFTIEVTNTGDYTLDPVRVKDTLPTWMSYVSSDPEADYHEGPIIWTNVSALNSGESTTITLVAHIDSGASGTQANSVNVTGTPPTGDNVTGYDTAEVTALTPDINVTKTASPTTGAPCTDVTFTIEVTNTGDGVLKTVRVVDTLPTWMSYVASDPEADYHEGQIIWTNVSALNSGESTTITLVAHIDSGASGTQANSVNVTGTPPTGDNVTGYDTAEVTALTPDINVTKTAAPTKATPGTDVTFTIEVTNTGDGMLKTVRVVDTLPAGMSYVATGSSPIPDSVVGNTITWTNVSALSSGASTTITLVAHIDSGASGALNNTANATGTPPTGENVTNSDTANVDVEELPPTPKAQVPAFTSVGLIALIGLLSVIAAISIKRRK